MSRIETEFAKNRKSEIRYATTKYYIFSEGEVTERKYFEHLNKSYLSKNVEIINILRDYDSTGESNPSKIIQLIDELLITNENEITIKELKRKLENWAHENNRSVKGVLKTISSKYNDNKIIKYQELKKIVYDFFMGEIYIDLSKNFVKYLNYQDVTYVPTIDKICLVVDRDKKSFTKKQYTDVSNFCKKNNIKYYVSNPCFELWLYMHFREIEKEKDDALLKNKYVSDDKRYIEDKLNKKCGYTKTSIKFSYFEPNIKTAIKREKKFEENIIGLEKKLGTNVGKLVNEIIN